MRKLLTAALAVAAVAALAGVAIAANTYEVHVATSSAKGKGSLAKPLPTKIGLGFKVGEDDPNKRATVVEKYGLGAEGVVANTKVTPRCKFTDVDSGPVPAKCKKALVGRGLVKNAAGPSNDQSLSSSSPCNLAIRLYNTGKGMAIRLDSNGKPPPPNFESDQVGCLLPISTAIDARFFKTKIGGVVSSDLRFTVPQNLKHPLPGVDNSIRETVNTVFLKDKVINGKNVGFYSEVGCKGKTRTTRGTFVTEPNSSQPAQKFVATKTSKC